MEKSLIKISFQVISIPNLRQNNILNENANDVYDWLKVSERMKIAETMIDRP